MTLKNEQGTEDRYRRTLDSLLEGCQIIGFDWRYLYLNDTAAKQGHRSKEELLGRTMMEMYPAIEDTEVFAKMRRCMDERIPQFIENNFTFPDGSKECYDLKIQPVAEGISICSVDITERKLAELELSSANKELVYQNEEKEKRAAELIIANKELAFQNEEKEKRAAELIIANKELAFQNEEKGKRAAELIIANKELGFQSELKEKRAEEKEKRAAELIVANKELVFQNEEKERRAAELIAANKELENAEDAIRKLNEELEQKVIDRTTQLQAVNNELEAFSYSVSHDLIAPLRSIDGFSQALLKDYHEKLDEQGKDFLRRVRAASQRMAQLIDDMLKLSHITRAEMRRERVDLSTIVREVADGLQKTQPSRRVEFIIADGMIDDGDPQLLRVGIENLLGNSWKYTGKNPAARIEFGVIHHDRRKAYYVRDNGVGFDMAYADKLFGAFQRLHSMAEFEGTGIGLATVQRIIHRHGGRVWAEAKINEGATFYFSL